MDKTTKFNPDFWEVTLSEAQWAQFTDRDHPYFEAPDDAAERRSREDRARALAPGIRALIGEILTPRQQEVILLYFFEQLNQRQIAEQLGISQQVVSEHLYGKTRNGRAVGGALKKLRKACARRGVKWE